MAEGVANEGIVQEMQTEFKAMLELDFDESKNRAQKIVPFMNDEWTKYPGAQPGEMLQQVDTTFDLNKLSDIAKYITTLPEGKKFLRKTERLMKDRADQVSKIAIAWTGEWQNYSPMVHCFRGL